MVVLAGLVVASPCVVCGVRVVRSSRPRQFDLVKPIRAAIARGEARLALQDVTSFDWDRAYVFLGYTSRDTIRRTLGTDWPPDLVPGGGCLLVDALDEGEIWVVFMHDGQVVAWSLLGWRRAHVYPKASGRPPARRWLRPDEAVCDIVMDSEGTPEVAWPLPSSTKAR